MYNLRGRCDNCGADNIPIEYHAHGAKTNKDMCEPCDVMPYVVARENLGVALSRLTQLILREIRQTESRR